MTGAWWNSWAQGWTGLGVMYTSVQVPLLVAMGRGRASLRRMLLSPLAGVPTMLAAGLGIVLTGPALESAGIAADSLSQAAIGFGICIATGYAAGRFLARGAGTQRTAGRGARVADQDSWEPGRQSVGGSELSLAGVRVAELDETKHFKFIGTTGTGKSTAIAQLLERALARGDRAIIADPDGGYLRRFYDEGRGDIILNPFDQR
jgi:hypothetical protein